MKIGWSLCCVITLLAHGARAAEVTLEITPPQPAWLIPTTGQPCSFGPGMRIEACPVQLQPEGMALVGEEGLILQVTPLLLAGNYEAALARVAVNFPEELALLEAGDLAGFLSTRIPTNGLQQLPAAAPAVRVATSRAVETAPGINEDDLGAESPRPVAGPNPFARRPMSPDLISASVLFMIGQSYFALQRYLPAETAFRLALQAVPDHPRAHESLGMLYLRAERYGDAREHLARALELGRKSAQAHAGLGYLEQQTRRYTAAADAFQRALALEPAQRTAQRGLLHALTESRQHAKAHALVEQLLRAEPNDAALWLYRARIMVATNRRDAAVASLETALRLGDDSAANRRACIVLHFESGNVGRAVELLRASSPADLPYPLVDQALAWLADENEWDSYRRLTAAVERDGLGAVDRSRLAMRRASLALHDGNRTAASAGLQDALALDPANAEALVLLAQLHRAERDYGRADLLLQRASDYPEVRERALVARAELAIERQDLDGALAHLQTVVSANPRAELERNIELLEDLALLRTQR